jgi:hypothetical protein
MQLDCHGEQQSIPERGAGAKEKAVGGREMTDMVLESVPLALSTTAPINTGDPT